MTNEQAPEPVASFVGRGEAVCVWSEKFGAAIWIVPEATGEDRFEITAADWHRLDQVADAVGGEIAALVKADGTRLEATEGWQERVRRRRLLDHQIHFDVVLARLRDLSSRISTVRESQRAWLMKRVRQDAAELSRLMSVMGVLGHEMTDDEIRYGFEAALRKKHLGVSPSVGDHALSPGDGALSVESARDVLRRERSGATDRP